MTRRALQIPTARVFLPLEADARYLAAFGGRGSAKSHYFGGSVIKKSVQRRGLHTVCLREVQKSLEHSVKRLLEQKIEALGVEDQFKVFKTVIQTPGDGLIIFQGMQDHTAASIKSLEGFDLAWVEEAQSLSQVSLDLLRPTIRKKGSQMMFSWNPNLATDPVDVFFRGGEPPPDSVIVEANYVDNPWFWDDTTLAADMEYDRRRDPDKYAHIWLGKYQQNSEARVFKNWKIEEFETPADAVHHHGADFGFSVDPTTLIRCHIVGRKLFIDRELYKVGLEIDHTPAFFDKLDPDKPGDARKWVIRADSARPETISYMQRHQYPRMEPALKGPSSVMDGIEFLKSYDIIVHPRCKHTIDELTLYCFKTDKQTGEILPVLEDKKNHVIDALRYALETVRHARLIQVKPLRI